jgi:hypothetical protein
VTVVLLGIMLDRITTYGARRAGTKLPGSRAPRRFANLTLTKNSAG